MKSRSISATVTKLTDNKSDTKKLELIVASLAG